MLDLGREAVSHWGENFLLLGDDEGTWGVLALLVFWTSCKHPYLGFNAEM
jgi:hypothetical protein